MHGVLYNICEISSKFYTQCILFTHASESSCILYLLRILHILNMLQVLFVTILVKIYFCVKNKEMSVVTFLILDCDILPMALFLKTEIILNPYIFTKSAFVAYWVYGVYGVYGANRVYMSHDLRILKLVWTKCIACETLC